MDAPRTGLLLEWLLSLVEQKKSRRSQYLEYLQTIESSWRQADVQMVFDVLLSDDYWSFKDTFRGKLARSLSDEWLPFHFVEQLSTLASGISSWERGTRVLVVSPFSKSVTIQSQRLDNLLRGFDLSNLQITTIDTPVTYSKSNRANVESRSWLSSSSWMEVLSGLVSKVRASQFDVVLVSAGSYSGPILAEAKRMGRSGIYLGSLLAPLFNLNSSRFTSRYFRQFSQEKTLLDPVEAEELSKRSEGFTLKTETLRAYLPEGYEPK